MASIIAHIGDLHIGSTVALCPPAVNLPDGGTWRTKRPQSEIWTLWLHFWDEIKRLRGRGRKKRTLYVVINGEVIEGDHHNTSQLISRNCVTQLGIAIRAFEPVFKLKPEHIFVIRGTPAHSGESGQWDEAFARDISAEPDKERNTHSWDWLLLPVEEILIDIAHHGRAGYRRWSEVTGAITLAAEITMDYSEDGERIPDLALRGHTHKKADSYDNFPVRVVHNLSWQFSTSHGYKLSPGRVLPIGGNIILVDGDDYDVKKVFWKPPRRKPWQSAES